MGACLYAQHSYRHRCTDECCAVLLNTLHYIIHPIIHEAQHHAWLNAQAATFAAVLLMQSIASRYPQYYSNFVGSNPQNRLPKKRRKQIPEYFGDTCSYTRLSDAYTQNWRNITGNFANFSSIWTGLVLSCSMWSCIVCRVITLCYVLFNFTILS